MTKVLTLQVFSKPGNVAHISLGEHTIKIKGPTWEDRQEVISVPPGRDPEEFAVALAYLFGHQVVYYHPFGSDFENEYPEE